MALQRIGAGFDRALGDLTALIRRTPCLSEKDRCAIKRLIDRTGNQL